MYRNETPLDIDAGATITINDSYNCVLSGVNDGVVAIEFRDTDDNKL